MGRPGTERSPMNAPDLGAVKAGEQPEEDGLLACLECGRWYQGLGSHVAGAHDMTADEYRERHELPRNRGPATCNWTFVGTFWAHFVVI